MNRDRPRGTSALPAELAWWYDRRPGTAHAPPEDGWAALLRYDRKYAEATGRKGGHE